MPVATREIKRKIKSIQNTRKITRAMEMVAAVKMRKAVEAVLATRAYANSAWNIIKDLSTKTDPRHHPLLQKRKEVKRAGVILITSNRGLCGGFNREIIERVADYIKWHKSQQVELEEEVILMGKRGRDVMFKHGHKIVAEFAKLDMVTRITEVTPMARIAISDFISGKYDKVVIAYTDFQSAVKQKPRIKKILPIEREDDELGFIGEEKPVIEKLEDYEYLFEPTPDLVLEQMLYRLIELQIYQALLESNASEHSARMMAMRNASESASDMIDDLIFTFNQARQQSITAELADISAGRAAVE
jgi:F-type H+-transporting ATPase subunit gamma